MVTQLDRAKRPMQWAGFAAFCFAGLYVGIIQFGMESSYSPKELIPMTGTTAIYAVIYACLGLGTYKGNRAFAILLCGVFLWMHVPFIMADRWARHDSRIMVLAVLFGGAFVGGVIGTFQYHKLRKKMDRLARQLPPASPSSPTVAYEWTEPTHRQDMKSDDWSKQPLIWSPPKSNSQDTTMTSDSRQA